MPETSEAQDTRKPSGKRIAWIGGGAVAVVALALGIVLLWSRGASAPAPTYAQDFSERPGLAVLDLQEDLEAADGWSTTLLAAGDPRYALGIIKRTSDDPAAAKDVADRLRGVNLDKSEISWTLNLSELWDRPASVLWQLAGKDLFAIGVVDPSAEFGTSPSLLLIVEAATGKVKSRIEMESGELGQALYLNDEVFLYSNASNAIQALKTADLNTKAWTTSASPMPQASDGHDYGYDTVVLDKYVATTEGYLKLSDGTSAGIAPGAGSEGVYLRPLPGTGSGLLRVSPESASESVVQRYNPDNDTTGWETRVTTPRGVEGVRMIGDAVLVTDKGKATAYAVDGDRLAETWSIDCQDCESVFANSERIVFKSSSTPTVTVARLADGKLASEQRVSESSYYAFVGEQTLYVVSENGELVAMDLKTENLSELWRSPTVSGFVDQMGNKITILDGNEGILGILGGDDASGWEQFSANG